MKKINELFGNEKFPELKKILRLMKLTVFFILISVGCVLAGKTYSQTKTLTLQMENCAVKEALAEIERQSEFRIMYSSKFVDVNREVSLDIKNQKIESVLNTLFAGTDVSYTIKDRFIVLITPELLYESSLAVMQQRTISGTVTDESGGQPLPGVTVVVKGTTQGTVTNADGEYSLNNLPDDATLVFSFVGMRTQEVEVGNQTSIDVIMKVDAIGLEEVVAIGYGIQKKSSLTSAVATIKGDEFKLTPITSTSNALTGRLNGVMSQQWSGEPGKDNSTIRIRGVGTLGNASALVIVDGIPRPLDNINPSDIESVTVLKDAASVAPYGIRGANGVILITTHRGKKGDFSVSFDSKFGWQTPINLPKEVSSYDYARYKNMALTNEGASPQYTDNDLEKFKNGSDPDFYPNEHVAEDYMNAALLHQHNISMTGGTDKISFYGSLGFLDQEGNFGSSIRFKRYNLRSNIDFNPLENTRISMDISASFKDGTYTANDVDLIFQLMMRMNPTMPLFFTNGKPVGYFSQNPDQMIHEEGYRQEDDYDLNVSLKFDQKFASIPGLSVKGNLSIDKTDALRKKWIKPYEVWQIQNDRTFFPFKGGIVDKPQLTENYFFTRSITGQFILNYDKSFGEHLINVLGVFEGNSVGNKSLYAGRLAYDLFIDELSLGSANPAYIENGGGSSKARQLGYAYRATYSYAGKYIFEGGGRYDGHYYFSPGNRFAFLPSFSAAWRLSEEAFFENIEAVDNLKLRFSWGKSGNLAGSPFQYLSKYNVFKPEGKDGNKGVYMIGGIPILSIRESLDPNTSITWEKAEKYNLGVDFSMYNGLINIEADVFYEKRKDMLIASTELIPAEYGIGIGQENNGVMENRGIDLAFFGFKEIGKDWAINTKFNLTYAKNKILEISENKTIEDDPERSRTGKPLGTNFGLKKLGYFTSVEEIENTPWAAGLNLKPGDIKYWDRNEDGKINSSDYVVIGNPRFPGLIYGFNLGIKRKSVDLEMFWQGAAKTDLYYSGWAATPFYQGDATMFTHHTDFWTPDNTNAEWSRLESQPSNHTLLKSDHWIRNGAYLRLKSASVAYSLAVPKFKIERMRIYLSGTNLLTFSAQDYIDPEGYMGGYPQQRVTSIGLQLDF